MDAKQRIHFIGIGGIGISGLARLYKREGWAVSGSDIIETELTHKLAAEGIAITFGQTGVDLPDADVYVYSDAVKTDNPERAAATATGQPLLSYFEALGEVANQYFLIAVAGTHGKTTTTAMLIDIMEEAGLDPTAIVGSLRGKTGSNFRAGKSQYFVVEADEYRSHFLYLRPDVLIITNLEHDHPDYYADLAAVQAEFSQLVANMSDESTVIYDSADQNVAPVLEQFRGERRAFDKTLQDPQFLRLRLPQPGLHNLRNAAAAATAALALENQSSQPAVLFADVKTALENFAGTWRRFQYKGDVNGAPVFDDYAHHPTEIAATLKGAREKYPNNRVIAVFQPHTYSRTKSLQSDFVRELAKADRVILVPIYAAREQDDGSVSSEQLAATLTEQGTPAEHFHTLEAAAQELRDSVGPDDVVLVMGAGDVTKIAELLTK